MPPLISPIMRATALAGMPEKPGIQRSPVCSSRPPNDYNIGENIQSSPDANYRDRFDDATIELVRTAKPLKRSYGNIGFHHSVRARIQLTQRLSINSKIRRALLLLVFWNQTALLKLLLFLNRPKAYFLRPRSTFPVLNRAI